MNFWRTIRYYSKKFSSYHISTYAASASFFIFTAIFPLLMLTLSILSYTPLGTETFLNGVTNLLPSALRGLFQYITADLQTTNVATLSLSLVATLWTAAKSMLGLLDGLNSIADINDTRNFVFKRMVCIIYMLVLIAGLLVTLGLRVFGQSILGVLQKYVPHLARAFSMVMEFRGVTLFFVISLIFALIYAFFPNKKMRFFMQIPGAMFTSATWLIFSELYSIYVENFSSFSAIYGSLGMVIIAMLWLYFCMSFVFVGAVINRIYPSIFWRAYVVIKYRRRERLSAMKNAKKPNKNV